MSFSPDYSNEIDSLRAQLEEKDRIISELKSGLNQSKSSNSDSYSRAQAAFRSAVESLQENMSSTDITGMSQLSSIFNDPNLETQITSLVSFLKGRLNVIPRLCAQLRGHVDFLTRLSESPKLQSLFLISDHTGSVFLEETARNLLLEQASRTKRLIAEYPQILSDSSFEHVSTINTALSLGSQSRKFDMNDRLQNIKKFLSEGVHDPNELSSLLLQEIVISSSLQRFASDTNDKLKQISRCINGLQPNQNSRKPSHQKARKFGFEIEEEEEERDEEYANILNPNDDDFDFEKTLRLAQRMAEVASKNQNQFNDDNQFNSSKAHHDRDFNYNHNSNYNYGYQNSSAKGNNRNSASVDDWLKWAKRLYYGLTQTSAESQDEVGLRIFIEEAALTSVGIYKKLHSSGSTKRKVSQWS